MDTQPTHEQGWIEGAGPCSHARSACAWFLFDAVDAADEPAAGQVPAAALGRVADLAATFRRTDPDDPEGWRLAGWCLAVEGRPDDAARALDAAEARGGPRAGTLAARIVAELTHSQAQATGLLPAGVEAVLDRVDRAPETALPAVLALVRRRRFDDAAAVAALTLCAVDVDPRADVPDAVAHLRDELRQARTGEPSAAVHRVAVILLEALLTRSQSGRLTVLQAARTLTRAATGPSAEPSTGPSTGPSTVVLAG